MTHAITFDTLKYAKKLKQAGFTEQQAELQAEALVEVIDGNLATKQDVKDLKDELKQDMKELEYHMTVKLGGMLALAVGILATIIKF